MPPKRESSGLSVRKIAPKDHAAFLRLLRRNGLPTEDIATVTALERPDRIFCKISRGDATFGFFGLEIHAPDALLRSLVLHDQYRGKGLGRAAFKEIETTAEVLDIERLYLLTETAADFFRKLGFEQVARAAVPPAIAATREFASICPDSAVCLTFGLTPSAATETH